MARSRQTTGCAVFDGDLLDLYSEPKKTLVEELSI